MAKLKINKKELRRLRQKDGFRQATELRLLVERLPNQHALDTFLLQVDDAGRRKAMYEFCLPFIKFPNPRFPSKLNSNEIVIVP